MSNELKKAATDWWEHEGKTFDLDWYQKRLNLGMHAFEAGWKAGLATVLAGSVREAAVIVPPRAAVEPPVRPRRLEQGNRAGMKPRPMRETR